MDKNPHLVEQLCASLKDSDYGARRLAALELEKIGDARAVAPLIAALSDYEESVREAAAQALGKIGRQINIVPSLVSLLDSTGEASFAGMLQKLDWYPDEKKRVEIVTRDWRLGEILGFPEAIDQSVRALFERPKPLSRLQEAPHLLQNAVSHSLLTPDIVNLIVIASSYEEISPTFRFRDIYYSVTESNIAVSELCKLVSPITTNILHLVKSKKTRTINMSDDDGSWETTVYFTYQTTAAKDELERRGNPPYEPNAYIKR